MLSLPSHLLFRPSTGSFTPEGRQQWGGRELPRRGRRPQLCFRPASVTEGLDEQDLTPLRPQSPWAGGEGILLMTA